MAFPRTFPLAARGLLLLACLGAVGGCRGGWDRGHLYVQRWKPAWRGQYKEATYRVGDPGADWRPHAEKGAQVAWRNRRAPGVIQVRSQCQEHGDSSLEQFTDHLRIDFDAWSVVEQRFVTLVDREAVRTTVDARLDGVPVKLELVVLKKNGCLFDLSYVAVPSSFAPGLPAFERVVQGFSFPVGRP